MVAPSHHGHNNYKLTFTAMSQFHTFKEEQFSQSPQFYNGYPGPTGFAPKTSS
jgi:hypothetical protein